MGGEAGKGPDGLSRAFATIRPPSRRRALVQTCKLQTATALAYSPWPTFDAALLVEDTLEIPVQVNGKLRDVIKVAVNAPQTEIEAVAKASDKVKSFVDGKTIKKVIVVPKKLVNIVVG